jgi:hypothetical protein
MDPDTDADSGPAIFVSPSTRQQKIIFCLLLFVDIFTLFSKHFLALSLKPLLFFLSLGDLCHGFGGQKLLQPEQVINIAAFLMDLLAQTKHRGAFEQAYVAFTKVRMANGHPISDSVDFQRVGICVQNLYENKVLIIC